MLDNVDLYEPFLGLNSITAPTDSTLNEFEKDKRLLKIWLMQAMGEHYRDVFEAIKDPKQMWDIATTLHADHSPQSRRLYYASVMALALEPGESFDALTVRTEALDAASSKVIPDKMTAKELVKEMLTLALLKSLPPAHPYAIYLNNDKSISLSDATRGVIRYEVDNKNNGQSLSQAHLALFSSASTPQSTESFNTLINDANKCHACGHKHALKDCWKFRRWRTKLQEDKDDGRSATPVPSKPPNTHPSRLVPKSRNAVPNKQAAANVAEEDEEEFDTEEDSSGEFAEFSGQGLVHI